ncbi:hypothetical protein [Nostoc sp.]
MVSYKQRKTKTGFLIASRRLSKDSVKLAVTLGKRGDNNSVGMDGENNQVEILNDSWWDK